MFSQIIGVLISWTKPAALFFLIMVPKGSALFVYIKDSISPKLLYSTVHLIS